MKESPENCMCMYMRVSVGLYNCLRISEEGLRATSLPFGEFSRFLSRDKETCFRMIALMSSSRFYSHYQ